MFAVKWLEIVPLIWKVLGSHLSSESDCCGTVFVPVPLGKWVQR